MSVLVLAAMIGGTIAGSIYDPLFIALLLISILIGIFRKGLVWIVAFAFAAGAIRYLIASANRTAAGLPASDVAWLNPTSTALAIILLWGFVRLMIWAFTPPKAE
ncbi:hypothetical protein [Agrobacterium tumefaciens]|uniref:hypothetical protein n=1 Tax=Agrobacterium tumefaciens TaxID=358 RepID=UPI00054D073D|nr:hypothetical protein [Agrobacterium tumefaciens]